MKWVVFACGCVAWGLSAGCDSSDPDDSEFQKLLTVEWTLDPPGADVSEDYKCKTKTLEEDLIVTGLRAISPPGTHHTVLSFGDRTLMGDPLAPDDEFDCYFADQLPFAIGATGLGTEELRLPEGVGFRVPAGNQMMVNLHLFNATDQPLSGESGVEVSTADDVEFAAGVAALNDPNIEIPPKVLDHVEENTCVIEEDSTIFYFWPHMHQLGTQMTIEINGETVFDMPYSFDDQQFWPVDLEVKDGDVLKYTCRYDNPTDNPVYFGGSTVEEMCFLVFWRYPAEVQYCAIPF